MAKKDKPENTEGTAGGPSIERKTIVLPTVGRQVHYCGLARDMKVDLTSKTPLAATVTEVREEGISLCVVGPGWIKHLYNVPGAPELTAGHWSWPARD